MSSDGTVEVNTDTLAWAANALSLISDTVWKIADGVRSETTIAQQGFGGGNVGNILNGQVLPKARDLGQAAENLSTVIGQTGTGMNTMFKGYTGTNNANNAAVTRVLGGDSTGDDK